MIPFIKASCWSNCWVWLQLWKYYLEIFLLAFSTSNGKWEVNIIEAFCVDLHWGQFHWNFAQIAFGKKISSIFWPDPSLISSSSSEYKISQSLFTARLKKTLKSERKSRIIKDGRRKMLQENISLYYEINFFFIECTLHISF